MYFYASSGAANIPGESTMKFHHHSPAFPPIPPFFPLIIAPPPFTTWPSTQSIITDPPNSSPGAVRFTLFNKRRRKLGLSPEVNAPQENFRKKYRIFPPEKSGVFFLLGRKGGMNSKPTGTYKSCQVILGWKAWNLDKIYLLPEWLLTCSSCEGENML